VHTTGDRHTHTHLSEETSGSC